MKLYNNVNNQVLHIQKYIHKRYQITHSLQQNIKFENYDKNEPEPAKIESKDNAKGEINRNGMI